MGRHESLTRSLFPALGKNQIGVETAGLGTLCVGVTACRNCVSRARIVNPNSFRMSRVPLNEAVFEIF